MHLHAVDLERPCANAPSQERARSEVVVARRYLDHGFLDATMRIFARHATLVGADDWTRLVARLLERGRVVDAVAVCQTGGVPLPRQALLALGDRQLARKDVDAALRYYELAEADRERWAALLDVLTRLPGRELQATEVAARHLVGTEPAATAPSLAASA
jgi:hypothetical protein